MPGVVYSIHMHAPTIAQYSISTVSSVASTCEGPECVGAGSTCMTRRLSQTFINVCRYKIASYVGDGTGLT